MMKKTILMLFLSATAWYVLTSTKIDPDNPPVGSTGAPSEKTCISSGCHTQGTPTGTIEVSGLPSVIAPNTTYQVIVKNTSTTGKATGFQMTCLDANNTKCGTFSTGTNVSVGTEAGREYPRNSKKTQLQSGAATWTFPWKSPAVLTSNKITFYYAGIFGNGDGKENKDGQFVGSKVVSFVTPTINPVFDKAIKIFPNPTTELLNIQLEGETSAEAYLFDINGHQVKKMFLDAATQINVKDLPKGIYQLQILAAEKYTIRKVIIQ
jgi:hypothetical protein